MSKTFVPDPPEHSGDSRLFLVPEEKAVYRFTIKYDQGNESPREDCDNLWTLVTHGRPQADIIVGCGHDSLQEALQATEKGCKFVDSGSLIRVPIYMYEHSGMALSSKPFSDPWDSGQVGEALLLAEDLNKEFASLPASEREARAREVLDGELKAFTQYLNGDIWQFSLDKADISKLPDVLETAKGENGELDRDASIDEGDIPENAWESEEACGGFYGSDVTHNGMTDYLPDWLNERMLGIKPAAEVGTPAP